MDGERLGNGYAMMPGAVMVAAVLTVVFSPRAVPREEAGKPAPPAGRTVPMTTSSIGPVT